MKDRKKKNPLVEKFGSEKIWVNWQLESRDGKKTKIPYAINGRKASSTDPSTWSTYERAAEKSDKIGIVFTADQKLLGIDIDHCIENGKIVHEKSTEIRALIWRADTYTEISPSGTGLHLYFELSEPLKLKASRHSPYEAYTNGRYFTVTLRPFEKLRPVRTLTPEYAELLLGIVGYPWKASKHEDLGSQDVKKPEAADDSALLEKIFSASNGSKIKALYDGDTSSHGNDKSRADMALLSSLAFWTGRDALQMERMWLASPIGLREKTSKRKDYRDRTIAAAIANCKKIFKGSKVEAKQKEVRKSPTDLLFEKIDSSENTLLFRDEQGDAFIALEVSGHREIWPCKSKAVKKWLTYELWKIEKKPSAPETIKSIIAVFEGRASFDGPQHKLGLRSTWCSDELWYDLADDLWRAIRISRKSWEIVDNPPILFRRYQHSKAQVTPISGGKIELFLKYINLKDEEQKLLLLVYLVSCFIPDFAHVALVIHGSQGSAKSTLSKMLRRIIDPASLEVVGMPDSHKELVQTLAHHAFLFFDNVSYISESTSDILCKAITGSGFSKRELYSDDEDIIYNFKRCIGINGINLVSTRPDLLERSLLIGLDRIDPADRKTDKELSESFEGDLPLIFGGILDALVHALQIHPTIKLTNTPRMADFTAWGCAIAEALGYTQEDFLSAYRANIQKQTEVSLNENVVATAVMSFMADKEEWRGSATNLLQELTNHAAFQQIDTYEKYWPKGSSALMRRLNELAVNLKAAGINFVSIPGNTREIILKKEPSDGTDGIS